jgi:hypothetical protein
VIPTLTELEKEFYELVTFIEATLKKNNVEIDTLTRRFSMLPQSIRRRYRTDEYYTKIRQKILDSDTVKRLFDNLTVLKHWNYMIPDTLAHIVEDVKIDDVHKKINEYKEKLLAFKASTKLRELVGISFPVPDYCMELTMEVEGWEDKTIQEVEDRAVNIVRRAAYSGSPHARLGWKGAFPGSINVAFILMESVKLIPEFFVEEIGVVSVHIDGLAGKIITLQQSSNVIHSLETVTTSKSPLYPKESSPISPTSPASSSGIEEASLEVAMSPLPLPDTPNESTTQDVISTLRELEEEFYDLVIFIEDTLKHSEVSLDTMTRRFRMLPQSVRRQHQTDENYTATRQKILNSTTIKELFDNLTELKQWNYMTPDTLAHIVKDVKIDDVHRKINKYKAKLLAFKATTKLRELVGISFPVPDYCMELTMEVEGWEDKTIQEVEDRAVNIVRRAAYSGSPHIRLGWKGVFPGSINVTFILLESVKLIPEKVFEEEVLSVHIDGATVCSKHYTKVNHKSTMHLYSLSHLSLIL